MEEHFLKDFVTGARGGSTGPWYNPDGDCIIYQTNAEEMVADRVDEVLTIYRSVITGKAIGCQIKGVTAIIQHFRWDGIMFQCKAENRELKEVSLYALLLAAYEKGPKTIGRRMAYADAFQSCAPHPSIPAEELEPVLN